MTSTVIWTIAILAGLGLVLALVLVLALAACGKTDTTDTTAPVTTHENPVRTASRMPIAIADYPSFAASAAMSAPPETWLQNHSTFLPLPS